MALKIDIAANTRQAATQVKSLGDDLETVVDALDDVGRGGDRTGDKLEKTLKDVERRAKDAGDGIKKGLGGGIKEGLDEAKNEAGQSGREAAASFGGGFEDIVDFVQETAANAFSGFGPIGAAAGIAVAAAIGTLMSNAATAQEKLNEARESAADLASTMYQNGGKLPLTERVENLFETLNKEITPNGPVQGLIDQWVDFGDRLSGIRDIAERTGRPVRELVEAMSGSDLRLTKDALDDVNAELDRMKSNVATAWVWETGPLEDYAKELQKVTDQERLARDTIAATDALNVKALEDLQTAWQNATTDASNYFAQTEEGATTFDWGAYLADAEATIAAADEMKGRLVGLPSDIRSEAERIFASQGAVAANEYTKAYESASAADKGRFISAASANGEATGTAQAQALKAAFGNPVLEATVKVKRDTREWDNWLPNPKTGVIMATVPRSVNQLG